MSSDSAVPGNPFDAVRTACAAVAGRARSVRIDEARLATYARELATEEVREIDGPHLPEGANSEALCAFVVELDAINFGSGYFPHLAKRPGLSGYRTVETCLLEHVERCGPLPPEELVRMTAERCASIFAQSLDSEPIGELMRLFARAWCDLGAWVGDSFERLVRDCDGSAARLVQRLVEMPLYRDIARHDELPVPLLKRAQLTVADLHFALPRGAGAFADLDQLTLFADNLVPHVLRLDGVLRYDDDLIARIEAGELLPAGSSEEVEIRALAVHAVERLASLTNLRARELDYWLWNRGAQPEYKAKPRHRTRCSFY